MHPAFPGQQWESAPELLPEQGAQQPFLHDPGFGETSLGCLLAPCLQSWSQGPARGFAEWELLGLLGIPRWCMALL